MPNPAYYDYDAAVQSPASYGERSCEEASGGLSVFAPSARALLPLPGLKVASRLIGEAAPPAAVAAAGAPSPLSTSGRRGPSTTR